MKSPAIEVTGLQKAYGAHVAVSGVDFSVVDLRKRLHTAHPVRLGSMHKTISDGRSSFSCMSSFESTAASTRKP